MNEWKNLILSFLLPLPSLVLAGESANIVDIVTTSTTSTTTTGEAQEGESPDDADDDDEEGDKVTEVRFVPDVVVNLDSMFKAMNECQLLHPDPADSVSEGDDDDDDDNFAGGDADDGPGAEYDVEFAERTRGLGGSAGGGEPMEEVPGQFDDAESEMSE